MRWRRFLMAMVVIAALVVITAWVAYPHALAALLQSRLPQVVVEGVVVERAYAAGAPSVAIALTLPQGRVVSELASHGTEVPAWLIRPGLAVSGRWTDTDLQADFPWSVTIVTETTPRCELALPATWVNAMLAAQSRSGDIEGLTWSYQFDPASRLTQIAAATISETSVHWRFAITASGFVSATLNGQTTQERVDRLTGEIDLTAQRKAGTWVLAGDSTIADCEHHPVSSESTLLSLMATNLGQVIELVVDDELSAAALAGIELPSDFPFDLEVNLVLTDAPLPGSGSAKDAPPSSRPSPALNPTPALNTAVEVPKTSHSTL